MAVDSSRTSPDTCWSTTLYVLAFPFELIAYAVARMRGKGFGMLLLLIIVVLPLLLWLFFPIFRSIGMGWLFAGAFAAAVMVAAAKSRLQSVELGGLECGFIWKLMVFIPGAFVLRVGLPGLISGWFLAQGADVVILVGQIVRWSFDVILLVTTLAAALRHYYEPRWRNSARMQDLIAAANQLSAPEASMQAVQPAEVPDNTPRAENGKPQADATWKGASPSAIATSITTLPSSAPATAPPRFTSDDPAELLNQAEILMNTGKWEFARMCLERLLTIDPSNAKGQTRLGESLFNLGRCDEARAAYQAAIDLNPNDIRSLRGLGQCHLAMEDPATAAPFFEACLEQNRKAAPVWADLAQCHLKLNRYQEAVDCCRQALANDPNHAPSRLSKAYAEEALGQPQEAIKSYQQFLNFAPPHMAAEIQYARERLQQLK
jgi:tetratricopeptide (TPR) repeat protein